MNGAKVEQIERTKVTFFYKEADSRDEWKERKEERESRGGELAKEERDAGPSKAGGELSMKRDKNGGADPEVDKRLGLGLAPLPLLEIR